MSLFGRTLHYFDDFGQLKLSLRLVCLIALTFVIASIYSCITYWTAKRRNGCEDAPRYHHRERIWGLDFFFRQKKVGEDECWLPTSKALFAKYGKTYEVNHLGRRMIHTMDRANMQSAFALEAKSWGVQPLREGIAVPFFGRGINTTDGSFHQYSRSLIRPTFARTEIADLAFLGKQTDILISKIPTDGSMVDLQPLFSCLFLDALTHFLFGESMDSMVPGANPDAAEFIKAFDYAMIGLGQRVRLGRLLFLHRDRKWQDAVRVVHRQVDRYIDNAFAQIEAEKVQASPEGTSTLPQRYILLHEMAKQTRDKEDLRSQILTVFMPGRDSIGFALSNVFHALARRPELYQKLREEVLEYAPSGTQITFELLKSMRYTQWVINEGHRVHPTTAQAPRVCLQDTILPTGGGPSGKSPIYVRKGDHLMVSMWGLHQDTTIWGSDAAEFRPERWRSTRPIWTYLPFMGGPRTCPAQQMVLIQEAYVLTRLVQAFERIESRDPYPWTEARRIGFLSKYGVKVALTPSGLDFE